MITSTYDTKKETEDIRLLALLKLLDVFEGTHLDDCTVVLVLRKRIFEVVKFSEGAQQFVWGPVHYLLA